MDFQGDETMNLQYNIQFEKLCHTLQLGEILKTPEAISGGLLHRMFSLETSKGRYAVKALNPQIMARPSAYENYILSERIASFASNYIPAQPAKVFNGHGLQNIDNQFYLFFDWIDGYSLKAHEVTTAHCTQVGSILAKLHKINFSQIENSNNNTNHTVYIDWNFYLSKGKEHHSTWADLLSANIDELFLWSKRTNQSFQLLAGEGILSHRDLDPKNVMWSKGSPIFIDWESAGVIHPKHDLMETAIYWSTGDSGEIDQEKFNAFVTAYQEHYGIVTANWRIVLELGYLSKLEWLEYSLKRSLWIECADAKEQEMGTKQVVATIHALKQYEEMIFILETWLNNE